MAFTPASQRTWPCGALEAVTPSDSADLTIGQSRWIFVGGAGNLTVVDEEGNTVLISTVPAGAQLPIAVTRIKATGTTATLIVAGR
jgi:hypothetical protein